MGADKKFSQTEARLKIPSAPNPRVLGEVQSSYREATLTQNNPRNKTEQAWKQTRENSTRNNTRYNSPVDPTHGFEERRFNR